MESIKCMLDKKEYKSKPQGIEIAKITNRLESSQTEISIKELIDSLIKGCTFKPSLLNGRREDNWIEQQLFALDFDENTTINNELKRCNELGILPVFGYTSFSHTEEHHKFRLVFCTNEVITDYNIAKQLQLTLMNIFNNCDDKCKNLSRLYFGGKQVIYEGFDNKIDCMKIINKYTNINEESNISSNNDIGEKKPHNNKYISSNTYIIVGRKTPSDESYYNIKAIGDRNVDYLKTKINNPKIILNNNQEFYDYIFSYDLGRLLEFKYPNSIRCIFHEDNNPSAGIFQNDEGRYIYHCFGCGVSYNLLQVIEKLGNFKSRPKAYKFIRDIFNIEIKESEWQREQKEILLENLKVINNGELEQNCPTAYKNISRNLKYLQQLIILAMDNVYSEKLTDEDDNVAFYASTRFIANKIGISESSAKEVSKKNVLFQYHNLLNKLSDSEVPEEMLKRGQAIGANKNDKKHKHINYYSIPSYTTVLFSEIEESGKRWNENNYTMKGLSREMFYRSEGELANKLYPQYTQVYDKEKQQVIDRTTTPKSNKTTEKIVQYIFNRLKEMNYVTEKDLISDLICDFDINIKKTEAEKQIKKSLNEILQSYNLKRIRCNKAIKEQYNVDGEGYPFIIVKNS